MASKFGHKHPRTTAESRAVEAATDQGVKVRRTTLPNAYDDIRTARQPRSDRYKNHRR